MFRVIVLAAGLLSSLVLHAAENEYQRWKRESLQQYQNYRSAQDAAFGSYLAKQWQEFKIFEGVKRDTTPKPQTPPTAPVSDKPVATTAPVAKQPTIPLAPATSAPKQPPVIAKPAIAKGEVTVNYFGKAVQLPVNTIPPFPSNSSPSNESISNWWQRAANGDHAILLDGVRAQIQQASLSDWATFQLLKRYGETIYPADKNSRVVLNWFVLTRLGYTSKMAYADGQLVLLLRTAEPLYETLYLESAGERFYVVDAPAGVSNRLHSYQGNHPDANRTLSLVQDMKMFDDSGFTTKRTVSFSYAGKSYQLTIDYQKSVIDYLNTIPPTELAIYFKAPEATALRKQLVAQLKPLMNGLNQEQSVNLLLAFVQHAFPYATDEDQFGKEHYMFADEIFHYPSSDCEDRAVLFAHLVRETVSLEVIGIAYPGHVATAIYLPGTTGKSFTYNHRNYVIADPTYINARAGMEMPQFRDTTPQLIGIM